MSPPYSICRPSTGGRVVGVLDDLLAERGHLLEAAVGDVELGEGDGAVGADLLGVVVRAGDGDPVLRRGEVVDLLERRPHLGIVDALLGLGDDLRDEAGAVGVVRLEQVLDVLRLAVGQREVGAVVGSDGAGDGVDADEQGDPGSDDDPAVADAGAGEAGKHVDNVTDASNVTNSTVHSSQRYVSRTVGDPIRRSAGIPSSRRSWQRIGVARGSRGGCRGSTGAGARLFIRRATLEPLRIRNIGADVAVGDWVVPSADGERVEHVVDRALGVRAAGVVRGRPLRGPDASPPTSTSCSSCTPSTRRPTSAGSNASSCWRSTAEPSRWWC